jgi:hypothetical protein
MRPVILCAALAVVACASNSGALPLGNGEYVVTVENDYLTGGVAGGHRRAIRTAEAQCGAGKVEPGVVQVKPQQMYTYGEFTMRFRCAG